MIILGIDPDRGWAVANQERKQPEILEAGTVKGMMELEDQIAELAKKYGNQDMMVRIERPNIRRPYARREKESVPVRFYMQGCVGQNREKSNGLERWCNRLGLKVEFVGPARKKLNAKQVRDITGYQERTNEHSRDAIMIAIRKGV